MLRDAAVDLIMSRLGKRSDSALRVDVISEMTFVQDVLLEGGIFLPWFLLSESATTTTTADDERVQLPSAFLGEWEEGALYRVPDTGNDIQLIKDDYEALKGRYTGTGAPTHYDLAGDYFYLKPTQDAAYTIKMRYYQRATSLAGTYGDATNIENLWLKWASDVFIGEVGVIIAGQVLQMPKAVLQFTKQAQSGWARLRIKDTSVRETNKERSMGDI